MRVALLSLEPWDEVWRRNQHLASQLVAQDLVEEIIFVEPAAVKLRTDRPFAPEPGIVVEQARLRFPRRMGGLRALGAELRRRLLGVADVLWINDPALGVHCLLGRQPAVYDVTDDWRTATNVRRIRRRIVHAEDVLATSARTIVCSEVLRERWASRYGLDPPIVSNAIDTTAFRNATPRALSGPGPHVGYVGTLHEDRLDLDLLEQLSQLESIGSIHLLGPNALAPASRTRLASQRIVLHGAVPAPQVPSWLRAMDVLICPHVVNDLTLSLDAIKTYEYLASQRPVVSTATSGFQALPPDKGLVVTPREGFVDAVSDLLRRGAPAREPTAVPGWDMRAREFATQLLRATELASGCLE